MVFIARWLRDGQLFTAETVARKFEVNRKTVIRDVEFMRDRLGYAVEFDHALNSWRLVEAPVPVL